MPIPRSTASSCSCRCPAHIDAAEIVDAIDPDKDVDGLHVVNTGRLAAGLAGMVPCTPLGCLILLKRTLGALEGRKALVLGRSNLVGKPMVQLLIREHCTVTVAHSRTRDLAGECRAADILVVAAGRPQLVRGDWIKPGAAVIDVGINRIDGGGDKPALVGDVAFDEAAAGGRRDHTGAGRRRPDDHRLPAREHLRRRLPQRRRRARGAALTQARAAAGPTILGGSR